MYLSSATGLGKHIDSLNNEMLQDYNESSQIKPKLKKPVGRQASKSRRKRQGSRSPLTNRAAAKNMQYKTDNNQAQSTTKDSLEDQPTTERESLMAMKPQFKHSTTGDDQNKQIKSTRTKQKSTKMPTVAPISVLNMAQHLMAHDNLNIMHDNIPESQ